MFVGVSMKKKWINILFIVAAVGLGVCSWVLLPAVVAVQVGFDGQVSKTMPKLLAVIIPAGLTVLGAAINLAGQGEKKRNGYILAVAGIAIQLLCLFVNR